MTFRLQKSNYNYNYKKMQKKNLLLLTCQKIEVSTDFFCLTRQIFGLTQPDFWSNSEFRRVTRRNRRKNTEKITLNKAHPSISKHYPSIAHLHFLGLFSSSGSGILWASVPYSCCSEVAPAASSWGCWMMRAAGRHLLGQFLGLRHQVWKKKPVAMAAMLST